MTTLDALELVIESTDETWWRGQSSSDRDQDALLAVAEAVLSGQLEECRSEADLRQAITEGRALVEMEVYSVEQLVDEAARIDDELMEWGDAVQAQQAAAAELN